MRSVTLAATIALMSLGGCTALQSLGEAPVGYRVGCVVQPGPSTILAPNSIRHSCRELPPVVAPAPAAVVVANG